MRAGIWQFGCVSGAADNGNAGAMNELGLFYEEAFSMVRDRGKAYEWFKKSVDNGGGACAEFNLSRCYRYGIGIEENDETADPIITDDQIKAAFFNGADPTLTKEEQDAMWDEAKAFIDFKIQQRKRKENQ